MTWLVEQNKQAEALQEKADAVKLFEGMLIEVQSMAFEQYQGANRLQLTVRQTRQIDTQWTDESFV